MDEAENTLSEYYLHKTVEATNAFYDLFQQSRTVFTKLSFVKTVRVGL